MEQKQLERNLSKKYCIRKCTKTQVHEFTKYTVPLNTDYKERENTYLWNILMTFQSTRGKEKNLKSSKDQVIHERPIFRMA